jgi:late embryogenesis abundant protein
MTRRAAADRTKRVTLPVYSDSVTNPNPFSLRLGRLKGTLFLEDSRAADVDFPLGLPLAAGGETTVPIDLTISLTLSASADSVVLSLMRILLSSQL